MGHPSNSRKTLSTCGLHAGALIGSDNDGGNHWQQGAGLTRPFQAVGCSDAFNAPQSVAPLGSGSCRFHLLVVTERSDDYSYGMVSARDKATIVILARRYGAATVWLFGSSTNRHKRGRDLDLAVEGVAPARFFQFVGDLMLALSKPVDVVALEGQSKLGALIRRDGIPVYGQSAREA
jgi:predicted nucleotidyltransferase